MCPYALSTRRRFFGEVISLKTHDARGIKLDEDSDSWVLYSSSVAGSLASSSLPLASRTPKKIVQIIASQPLPYQLPHFSLSTPSMLWGHSAETGWTQHGSFWKDPYPPYHLKPSLDALEMRCIVVAVWPGGLLPCVLKRYEVQPRMSRAFQLMNLD